jgi:hypothetical protein
LGKISKWLVLMALALTAQISATQSGYQVISVRNGGKIRGTVNWEGPPPHLSMGDITKDAQICDPLGQKRRDLERLIVSPNDGVANAVVFLNNITTGKAMDLLVDRQSLNQKTCRYEPHILLVPVQAALTVTNSDPLLHTVFMSGSADWAADPPSDDAGRSGRHAQQCGPRLDERGSHGGVQPLLRGDGRRGPF